MPYRIAFLTAAALGLALLLGGAPLAAHAHEGHDHGDAPATPAGPALPRFAATSELFELVGIVDGRSLSVYLDHAVDNSPVKDARLELEIGGSAVPLEPVAEGEFRATLAQALPVGLTPVTATVVAGAASDLLAGELDLHADTADTAAPGGPASAWARRGALLAAAAVALAALAVWLRRRRAGLRVGGAA